MPKAKWGSSVATSEEVNNVDTSQRRQPYMGSVPPSGVYRFILKYMEQGTSQGGNDKIIVKVDLDGEWRPEHKKFDGYPMWDHMPMSVAARLRSLEDALGVSHEDLLNRSMIDEKKRFTKIGKLPIPPAGDEFYLYIDCEKEPGEKGERLIPRFAGYLVIDEDALEDGAEETEGDEPAPF